MLKRNNYFKKVLLSAFFCAFFNIVVIAQQLPQYTQYVVNNFLLNPAIAGIENYADLRLGRRIQWQGIVGAPVTNFFSIHMPVGSQYVRPNYNSLSGVGEHPFSRSYLQNYQAAENHHGIGAVFFMDKTGPFNRTEFSMNYAYHLGLSNGVNMSFGVAPSISIASLDYSQINTNQNNDTAVQGTSKKQYIPNVDAGLWIYGAQFYFGASVLRAIPTNVNFSPVAATNAVAINTFLPHFFTTAGLKFSFTEDVAFQTSVMLKYVKHTPYSLDYNVRVHFKDIFWTGVSYRSTESFSFMLGVNPNHYFNVSYSYDMVSSALSVATTGSHEIVLSFLLNNSYSARCPEKMW